MFTYIDAQPTRPSLLTMMEEYWKRMPVYQVPTQVSVSMLHLGSTTSLAVVAAQWLRTLRRLLVGLLVRGETMGGQQWAVDMHCCLPMYTVSGDRLGMLYVHLLCREKVHKANRYLTVVQRQCKSLCPWASTVHVP